MKRLIALFLLLTLLTGCTAAKGPEEAAEDETVLSLTQELEQARQVKIGLAIPELEAFESAALALRDQGLDFLSYGMTRQASYCFSFAGANVSSLRLAAQQLAGQTSTGFSDWDTVGAISFASPVPFWCEALVAHHQGDIPRAQECREMAAMNENAVDFAADLECITLLSEKELAELAEKLSAFEEHLYWFYPADPIAVERCGMEWSVDYHLSIAAGLESINCYSEALPYYQDALAQDPFNPDLFLLCAKAMYNAGEINLMRTYLEEGLLMEPEHPGLNAWAAMLWLAAGDAELAKYHLEIAMNGELSEEDSQVCYDVQAAMEVD